jgi:hypothetical protein
LALTYSIDLEQGQFDAAAIRPFTLLGWYTVCGYPKDPQWPLQKLGVRCSTPGAGGWLRRIFWQLAVSCELRDCAEHHRPCASHCRHRLPIVLPLVYGMPETTVSF